jgi:hypothetical protein
MAADRVRRELRELEELRELRRAIEFTVEQFSLDRLIDVSLDKDFANYSSLSNEETT